MKLGPGGLQSWAGDIIVILRQAHQAAEEARARGSTALGADLLGKLRERYDEAAATGIIHNRLRDWHEGNHPGYALGCWLRDYKEQVFLFTPPRATRPSPATGTPSPPSPAGAASGATWIPPPPTASPRWKPLPLPCPASPGCPPSPPQPEQLP
jgi:hypothetical protein